MSKKIVIVGGHGQIALRLARLLAPKHDVTSIIRDPAHADDITATKAKPHVLNLLEASSADFVPVFTGADVVYFAAGSDGKSGDEGFKTIDYEGAIKVFDAIEAVQGPKPRLVLISSMDIRDPSKPIPAHYDEKDKEMSARTFSMIPGFMKYKFDADKNLSQRTAFKWTILRPNWLTNDAGTGKVAIGRTHIIATTSRDHVAQAMALLLDREDAASLAFDITDGEVPIEEALDAAIKKGETDFFG
ncbi:hypothetical protein C8Q77DRAFT_1162064 [Trametes polyzona]|nr:hypothetical protein C8Q77DRAFT_1162064 [Trametes polyzona]